MSVQRRDLCLFPLLLFFFSLHISYLQTSDRSTTVRAFNFALPSSLSRSSSSSSLQLSEPEKKITAPPLNEIQQKTFAAALHEIFPPDSPLDSYFPLPDGTEDPLDLLEENDQISLEEYHRINSLDASQKSAKFQPLSGEDQTRLPTPRSFAFSKPSLKRPIPASSYDTTILSPTQRKKRRPAVISEDEDDDEDDNDDDDDHNEIAKRSTHRPIVDPSHSGKRNAPDIDQSPHLDFDFELPADDGGLDDLPSFSANNGTLSKGKQSRSTRKTNETEDENGDEDEDDDDDDDDFVGEHLEKISKIEKVFLFLLSPFLFPLLSSFLGPSDHIFEKSNSAFPTPLIF